MGIRRNLIATAGTSIARGIPPEVLCSSGAGQEIRQRVDALTTSLGPDKKGFLTQVSAEINGLARLQPTVSDVVWLLHTQTQDGKACAAEIAKVASDKWGCKCMLKEIHGLQVQDAHEFRTTGVQGLFSELDSIRSLGDGEPILNVTGGFKSVVPYVTLYGLLHRLKVVYVFELSDALITLPEVPVGFDEELLARAGRALRTLDNETSMQKDSFFSLIDGCDFNERRLFDCLIEDVGGGQVTVSAFGMIYLAENIAKSSEIMLSHSVKRKMSELKDEQLAFFQGVFDRIGDVTWRKSKMHRFEGTDLLVVKPGSVAERAAYFVRAGKIFVCLIYTDHSEYERDLGKRNISDFPEVEFSPWIPRQEVTKESYDTESHGLKRKVEDLTKELTRKEEELEAGKDLIDEAEKQRLAALYARKLAEENCGKLENRLGQAESRLLQAEGNCRSLSDELASYSRGGFKAVIRVIRNSFRKCPNSQTKTF